jgi:hypothetical protein
MRKPKSYLNPHTGFATADDAGPTTIIPFPAGPTLEIVEETGPTEEIDFPSGKLMIPELDSLETELLEAEDDDSSAD